MKLPNYVFDFLKWCTMVFIPAITALYVSLSKTWGFPYAPEVAATSAAVCAFLGCILGISNLAYKQDHEIVVIEKEKEE